MARFIIFALLVIVSLQYFGDCNAILDDDTEQELFERDLEDSLIEKREATEFVKRLFHPFSTKNEEIKRETREVYEEKCESIVPTQRFCPDLKLWKAFKDYENGSR